MNYTEETRAADEASVRKEMPRGRLPVRVALATLFLLSSLPLGLFWFLVLVVLLLGRPATDDRVGRPAHSGPRHAREHRWRQHRALAPGSSAGYQAVLPLSSFAPWDCSRPRAEKGDGPRPLARHALPAPAPPDRPGRGRSRLRSGLLGGLATYPLWFWTLPEGQGLLWSGVFVADTLPEALLVMLVGLVVDDGRSGLRPGGSQGTRISGTRLARAERSGEAPRTGGDPDREPHEGCRGRYPGAAQDRARPARRRPATPGLPGHEAGHGPPEVG